MSEEPRHIVCPNCNSVNRIPSEKEPRKAKCGHCHQPLFTGRPVPARLAGLLRSRNREPTIVEPVSAPPKRKLENRHQRPEPETRPARAEMPEIADQRLGHPSLTCGNVGDSPPPGNNTPETTLLMKTGDFQMPFFGE